MLASLKPKSEHFSRGWLKWPAKSPTKETFKLFIISDKKKLNSVYPWLTKLNFLSIKTMVVITDLLIPNFSWNMIKLLST
jgi:hypothetical protein